MIAAATLPRLARWWWTAGVAALIGFLALIALPGGSHRSLRARDVRSAYWRAPLSFVPNRGQAAGPVHFMARGAGYSLGLTRQGPVLSLARGLTGATLRSSFSGGRATSVSGVDRLAGRVNYLLGNRPARWHTNLPTYGGVSYRGVWPGIDVVFYGNQRRLEYDYRIAAGADPGRIGLRLTGARALRLDGAGDLMIRLRGGVVRQLAPRAYQLVGGARRQVASRYVLRGDRVGIRVGAYDPRRALTIDPSVSYSTFLGGSGLDLGNAIAVDSDGNAYVAGRTASSDFPASDGVQQKHYGGGGDAFVTKYDSSGAATYSTYLGGSDVDRAYGVAADKDGSAYVTGRTWSTDFPVDRTAFQSSKADSNTSDAFVAKLSADGTTLRYGTYIGGSDNDIGWGIALDGSNDAFVAGETSSTDFPVTTARVQTGFGGRTDAFVTEVNPDGTGVLHSSYLGGSENDFGYGIAVDPSGNAYVAGSTSSSDFPTASSIQAFHPAANDAFVSEVASTGSTLSYSTFLGGTSSDAAQAIAVDSTGAAYVTGSTSSTDFPTSSSAFQKTNASGSSNYDAFVTKVKPGGTAFEYSSYLGGVGFDSGNAIAVNGGEAYVTGEAQGDFPTTDAATQGDKPGGSDGFISHVKADGSKLLESTYIGGSGADAGNGIAVSDDGAVFVTGQTAGGGIPISDGAAQKDYGGSIDAFVSVSGSLRSTSASLTCGTTTVAPGKAVSCTVTVSDSDNGPGSTPTGDVSFATDGNGSFSAPSCTLGGNLASGSCQVSYTPATVGSGTHTITATYSGDGSHGSSKGTASVFVKAPPEKPPDETPPADESPEPVDELDVEDPDFRALDSGPSATESKKKAPLGTHVDFKLDKAAAIRFTVSRPGPGRNVKSHGKKKCVKQTKANRKKPACTRYTVLPGSFTIQGVAGKNRFRFTGRLNGKKLKPGNYRLTGTAIVAGKPGRPAITSFRIVA